MPSVAKLRAESRICPNAGGEEASSLRRARLVFDFVFKTFAFDVASSTAPLDSDGQAPLPTPATSTKPPLHDALLARSCAECRGRYSDRSHHETSGTSAVHTLVYSARRAEHEGGKRWGQAEARRSKSLVKRRWSESDARAVVSAWRRRFGSVLHPQVFFPQRSMTSESVPGRAFSARA